MKLDASLGHGGGQVLRTALGLAAVAGEPIEIDNIRANRPQPGLRAQHAAGARALCAICGGEMAGCETGSSRIALTPGSIRSGSYEFDVGTAGSVALVMQTILPTMLASPGPISVAVRGGTDVPMAPQWDYFENVLAPALETTGCRIDCALERRGYAPKGGGHVRVSVVPAVRPRPLFSEPVQTTPAVSGRVHTANLPGHVADRVHESAVEVLDRAGISADVAIARSEADSPGCGLVLWSRPPGRILGASCLGEVRLPAEKVGSRTARDIRDSLTSGASVDVHLADQLVPFIGLWGGAFTCAEATAHLRTNVETTRRVLGLDMSLEKTGALFAVSSPGRYA